MAARAVHRGRITVVPTHTVLSRRQTLERSATRATQEAMIAARERTAHDKLRQAFGIDGGQARALLDAMLAPQGGDRDG